MVIILMVDLSHVNEKKNCTVTRFNWNGYYFLHRILSRFRLTSQLYNLYINKWLSMINSHDSITTTYIEPGDLDLWVKRRLKLKEERTKKESNKKYRIEDTYFP